MDERLKTQIHEELVELRSAGPKEPRYGICYAVGCGIRYNSGAICRILRELVEQWDEFSGDYVYPVPGLDGACPVTTYEDASGDEMWSPDHPYGAARLRLLEYLIERTKP